MRQMLNLDELQDKVTFVIITIIYLALGKTLHLHFNNVKMVFFVTLMTVFVHAELQ